MNRALNCPGIFSSPLRLSPVGPLFEKAVKLLHLDGNVGLVNPVILETFVEGLGLGPARRLSIGEMCQPLIGARLFVGSLERPRAISHVIILCQEYIRSLFPQVYHTRTAVYLAFGAALVLRACGDPSPSRFLGCSYAR